MGHQIQQGPSQLIGGTAKITEVANRLGSKRCEKYRVAKGPIIGREWTTREKSRSRKVHKSRVVTLLRRPTHNNTGFYEHNFKTGSIRPSHFLFNNFCVSVREYVAL